MENAFFFFLNINILLFINNIQILKEKNDNIPKKRKNVSFHIDIII